MTEADVWRALIATLRDGLDAQGLDDTKMKIKQAFQPRKQGVNSDDTVYLFKITSKRIGHQGKGYEYNAGNGNFDSVENYWLEAYFQLTAQVERDIEDSSSLTAYDIADLCAAILQTSGARAKLLDAGIGILRIGEVRNPYSIDDRDQFDQDSSFDFVLTYNQTIASIVPVADPIEAEIHRV